MGAISAFTIRIKILFQEVWKYEAERQAKQETKNEKPAKGKKAKPMSQAGWDNLLPSHIQSQWNEIKNELPNLQNIRIPRCLVGKRGSLGDDVEIFAFGDFGPNMYSTFVVESATTDCLLLIRRLPPRCLR